jgi:hypothetical protein
MSARTHMVTKFRQVHVKCKTHLGKKPSIDVTPGENKRFQVAGSTIKVGE